MNLTTLGLHRPEERSTPFNNPAVPLNEAADWTFFGGGNGTDSGELVNDATSLQIASVFSCVRILAGAIASLPLKVYSITPQGKIHDAAHPLQHLLGFAPNDDMNSVSWIDVTMVHLSLTGNAYSEIQRTGDGSPVGLWPLNPRRTEPIRLPTGALAYKTTDGMTGGQNRIIASKDMLHVPLTTWDGIVGMSPIMQCRQALGMAIASERFGNRFFANFAVPQLALMLKKLIKPEEKMKMRKDWEALQSGPNQHRIAILDQEMTLEKISVTPEEAQFLEQRRYTRSEIGAIFGIPSHRLGELQKLSNSNTENMDLSFVKDTLKDYSCRIEAEITRKLITKAPGTASNMTVAFDYSERLRGDSAAQAAMFTAGKNGGWLSSNDIRRSMGLNEGGPELDVYTSPINYQNAERLLDQPSAEAQEPLPDAA